jgi:hypothetical protein
MTARIITVRMIAIAKRKDLSLACLIVGAGTKGFILALFTGLTGTAVGKDFTITL